MAESAETYSNRSAFQDGIISGEAPFIIHFYSIIGIDHLAFILGQDLAGEDLVAGAGDMALDGVDSGTPMQALVIQQ